MRIAAITAAVAWVLLCVAGVVRARAETMRASWYGFESGTATASGVRFKPLGHTAAHRKLPFGTRLRVTYQGRAVDVEVTDCGPYPERVGAKPRQLDVALGVAREQGWEHRGVVTLDVEVLSLGTRKSRCG